MPTISMFYGILVWVVRRLGIGSCRRTALPYRTAAI